MYSHVATAVDDLGAMFLESVARNSPTALTSLRVDLSQLNDKGLTGVKKVLKQSNLEQLFVECEPFDSSWSSLVGQALGAVRWSNIVSLGITGAVSTIPYKYGWHTKPHLNLSTHRQSRVLSVVASYR